MKLYFIFFFVRASTLHFLPASAFPASRAASLRVWKSVYEGAKGGVCVLMKDFRSGSGSLVAITFFMSASLMLILTQFLSADILLCVEAHRLTSFIHNAHNNSNKAALRLMCHL